MTINGFQIGSNNGKEHGGQVFRGLEFDHHMSRNQQIQPMLPYYLISIRNGNCFLPFKGDVSSRQFNA